MSQHTPGPWIYDSGSFYAAVQLNDNGMTHESPIIDMGDGRPENYEANARLIAAAPELLSAVSKAVRDAEQRVFEEWLESSRPSGDAEEVHRQWLASSNYLDFADEWREQIDAIDKATGAAA